MAAPLHVIAKLSVILRGECVNSFSLTGKRVKRDDDSAIKEHFLFCNNSPDFENLLIITTNNNDFEVTSICSLLINRDKAALNKKN